MKAPLLTVYLLLYAHMQVYGQLQLTHVSKVVTRLSEHCHIVITLAIIISGLLFVHALHTKSKSTMGRYFPTSTKIA